MLPFETRLDYLVSLESALAGRSYWMDAYLVVGRLVGSSIPEHANMMESD